MEHIHDIYYEKVCVGQVQVQKEGLYYQLNCVAKAPGSSMYRLLVRGENFHYDLGLCIPKEGGIGILTRVPIKVFTEDDIVFELKDHNAQRDSFFVPVCSGKVFQHLERLEGACLEYRDGIMGVCFHN